MSFKKHFVLASLKLISHFSFMPLQQLGCFLGTLAYHLPTEIKRIAKINLHLCYPTLSLSAQKRLLKASLQQTVINALEMAAIWQWPPQKSLSLIKIVQGEEAMLDTYQRKEPMIILVPHLANWEILNLYLATKLQMVTLYRPPKLTFLDKVIRTARERLGTEMVPTTNQGVRKLFKAISTGKPTAILPDQDPGESGGEFVPFMGIETLTMTLAIKLAQKSRANVFFAFTKRLPKAQGFELYFQPADPEIYNPDMRTALTALNRSIQQCIEVCPEQYQWTYKRFKRRPPGELDFYHRQYGLKP